VTGTLAATENSDTVAAEVGGPVVRVTEAGDGVAATGTAFTPLRGIVHWFEP
jgi:hypothetical protein